MHITESVFIALNLNIPVKIILHLVIFIDASIEYNSSLNSGIPGTALWEYYMPYKKIVGTIKFDKI